MKSLHTVCGEVARHLESFYHKKCQFPEKFPDKYMNRDACKDFQRKMKRVELESLLNDIRATQQQTGYCFMMDGSTDISVNKLYAIYISYISPDGKPCVRFLGLREFPDEVPSLYNFI